MQYPALIGPSVTNADKLIPVTPVQLHPSQDTTCLKTGHGTASSICPLRPKQTQTEIPNKIYRNQERKTPLNSLVEGQNTNTKNNNNPPNLLQIKSIVNYKLQEFTTIMTQWVSSVLTLSLPEIPSHKLYSAINLA